jgi:hypothetical protein
MLGLKAKGKWGAMSQRVETRNVPLTAVAPIELDHPGVIMQAGTYRGTCHRTGLLTHDGMRWTTPQYKITFSADQLRAMGADDLHSSTTAESFTVTEFGRAHKRGRYAVTSEV